MNEILAKILLVPARGLVRHGFEASPRSVPMSTGNAPFALRLAVAATIGQLNAGQGIALRAGNILRNPGGELSVQYAVAIQICRHVGDASGVRRWKIVVEWREPVC